MDGYPDVDLDCGDPKCKKDNCKMVQNPDQKDIDRDGTGDLCDEGQFIACGNYPDSDGDSVGDACDNCRNVKNRDQSDIDHDDVGDLCDDDMDGDGLPNNQDKCPKVFNRDQLDTDLDGIGDACDNCPNVTNVNQKEKYYSGIGEACYVEGFPDSDNDGIPDQQDNCKHFPNSDQLDNDKDFFHTNINFFLEKPIIISPPQRMRNAIKRNICD